MLLSFDVTSTTELFTLSLHDALPILNDRLFAPRDDFVDGIQDCGAAVLLCDVLGGGTVSEEPLDVDRDKRDARDRKSTRLNSSHRCISYAVFCLKKKKYYIQIPPLSK